MSDSTDDRDSSARMNIRISGARTHNLRNVDLDLPLGQLTVLTGVSGSGKSSLAFDTIFAEGRYRYLSSVSARSRELLQNVDRPDVDFIDGLPPVLCVEQRLQGARRRSTVATASEIYDYLRLLFARIGVLYCPTCHQPVDAQSRAAIVAQATQFPDRQKVVVLAPVVRGRTGEHHDVLARIVKDGYIRARIDGEIIDATSPPEIPKGKPHDIDIVVDRLIVKEGIRSRLEESVDLALQLGQGQCILSVETTSGWEDRLFSTILSCTTCGTCFPTLEPRSFSFNSAVGACATCHGLGVIVGTDEIDHACDTCGGSRLGPIPRAVQIDGVSITDFCALSPVKAFETIENWSKRNPSADSQPVSSTSSKALEAGKSDVDEFAVNSSGRESISPQKVAMKFILPEIAARLRFLEEVGLDYLTLDRGCETLSAGELQRTRLAASLGSQLTGVCYILDEPTSGLHPRDTGRLMKTLVKLRDEGNTVLLVEHDLDVIRQSDYVIELGPGAGPLGGQVIATGSPQQLEQNSASLTGPFLKAVKKQRSPKRAQDDKPVQTTDSRSSDPTAPVLRISGATLHNLKDVTFQFPLKQLVCVTGVSGSGKSSLVMQTLVPAVRRALGERMPPGGPFQELAGIEHLSRLIQIDQSALGRSGRSSPATYSGIWNEVRQIFAKTRESRLRGFSPRQFSLTVPQARCPRCAGRGQLPVEEQRFADWTIRCPECDGRRFSPATLSVRYRGKTVADILELSISESAAFFANLARLSRTLNLFDELGLGYLKLGQSATTLSGGEAQRIKLGTELAKSAGTEGSTLFVLDEPTAGLHVADVQQLVNVLKRLVTEGHSVLVIEHNQELVASADWVVEIGPDAGPNGGTIVDAGPPDPGG